MTDNDITHEIICAAIEVHQLLSSVLLESAYEEYFARELHPRNLSVDRQVGVPVGYKETKRECGYRTDPLVEGRNVVKLKSAESIATHPRGGYFDIPRMSGHKITLRIHFHVAILKGGVRRFMA
jgi:GxxExxY protein